MLEQRIQQQFFESADLKYQSAETLARPVAEAAQALLGAITGGGKVLVFAAGAASSLAPHFAQLLVGRYERERPPLAALALGAQAAQQVRALGLPGDVLLTGTPEGVGRLGDGDVVEVEIDGIGTLANPVVA